MKFLAAFLLTGASFLIYSCAGTDSLPGCQTTDSYCKNYSGNSWYEYPYTTSDLRDNCGSGNTFYSGGCPEKTAYAVCQKDDYDEGFNFEYVIYIESLSAGLVSFNEDECKILNNN